MAKQVTSYSFKGELNLGEGRIIESTKEEDKVFDFMRILQEWDGAPISLSMKLETEPPQAHEFSDEDDEDDNGDEFDE